MSSVVSLFPFDPACRLLTNLLWTRDERGHPHLRQQHLWVRFPQALTIGGARFAIRTDLDQVRFESSPDEGDTWMCLATVRAHRRENGDCSDFAVEWAPRSVDNLRVVVAAAPDPFFPLEEYFAWLQLDCEETAEAWHQPPETPAYHPLIEEDVCLWQPVAGDPGLNIYDRLGRCHRLMETNRVAVAADDRTVMVQSPVLTLGFARDFALVRSLGWDMGGREREAENLLSTANTQGAFPVVGRGLERCASDVGGGRLNVNGRRVAYRDVSVVPEMKQSLVCDVREDGFRLALSWECAETFRTAEIAALRLPFDLYRSVVDVLAMPDTTGPSGLVGLPLVIHAPRHGTMRVTMQERDTSLPVLARVSPFRAHAELWLDLIVGAQPLPNGLFEVPAGSGRVVLDFQLTKIFPFAGTDLFSWWQRPPSYSFVDREMILGALPNEWLSGVAFRPDLARFANNSVSEAATLCASFYADLAAYTPDLAPGLAATDLIRSVADTLLLDPGKGTYSDFDHWPMALSAPLDCAWLYVAATGDWEWAARRRDDLCARSELLLSHEFADTGMAASTHSGRRTDPTFTSASWFDALRSGHLESFNVAHNYRGMQRAAEMLQRLGEEAVAARLRAMAGRAQAHFLDIFYDPAARRIAQWVDVDGQRYGFDSRSHLGAAIVCGLVPERLARALLVEYLGRLARRGFAAYQYGLPIFLDPIPPDLHNNWKGRGVERDGTDAYGVYQNGSVTHHHVYLLLQALYQVGLRHEANDLFIKVSPLARAGDICGGLHSGVDWRHEDGTPSGYEGLLAEQFQFLLAAITGYLGWELTMDGLKLDPAVAATCSARVRSVRPNFARRAS